MWNVFVTILSPFKVGFGKVDQFFDTFVFGWIFSILCQILLVSFRMIDGSHGNNNSFACFYGVWHATFIFWETNHVGNAKCFLSIIAIRLFKVDFVYGVVLT